MIQLSRWKIIVLVLSLVLGVLFALPNVLTQSQRDTLPGFMPKATLNLGLDLRGGSQLMLEVDVAALKAERINNLMEEARVTLNDQKIPILNFAAEGNGALLTVDPANTDAARTALEPMARGGQGAASGITVTRAGEGRVRVAYTDAELNAMASTAVGQAIEVIRRRLDSSGTKEINPIRQGATRIVVQAPGESDPDELERLIGQTAKLTFQMVDTENSVAEAQAGIIPPDSVLMADETGQPMLIKKRVLVSGENLNRAFVDQDQNGQPAIGFRFDSTGSRRFAEATAQNIGKPFAIILDGKIISAPRINSVIPNGAGIIEGGYTYESASEMVTLLNGGALPAPLEVIDRRVVTAELGADAVAAGAISTAVGFAIIVIFMLLAYGFLFGGISVIGLLLNGLLIIAAMSMMGAALTLPGIAGLILTFAVAVDANVLIYERMRDEARAGKSVVMSMDAGFSRAMGTIIDANLTSLVAAVIMFAFGAGPVKGFAWTLSIGVFTSVLSSVLVAQVLLAVWLKVARPKKLPIAE